MRNEIIIEVPHIGDRIPQEVQNFLAKEITEQDLINESDLYADKIYLEQEEISEVNKIRFDYYRAIIDVNRLRDNLSDNGIIKKRLGRTDQKIYSGKGLPDSIRDELIKKYADVYYFKLQEAAKRKQTKLIVLGHTMDSITPLNSKSNPGEPRPLITVANGGDNQGNPLKTYQVSREIMEFVRDELIRSLDKLDFSVTTHDGKMVSFNQPYRGSISISRIGRGALQGKKAIMFEINKSLANKTIEMRAIIGELIENVLAKIT